MKKKYNKAVCLDTCLFNNIVGFPDSNPNFSHVYNKDLLIKYIKHHGYNMSDYNLYEVLRRNDWNDEKIISNLLKLNSKTNDKLKSKFPEFKEIIKNRPNEKSRNAFIETMFTNIIEFASYFYSQILNFPLIFVLYYVLQNCRNNNIYYDYDCISNYIQNFNTTIQKHLKDEFISFDQYTKSNAEKILNKYYLIINHLTIEWSNTKITPFANKLKELQIKEKDLYILIEDYNNALNNFNFNQEIILENGRKKANNNDNIIYLMSNQGFEENREQLSQDEWILKFSTFIQQIFTAHYDTSEVNYIIKTYYENTISDFYIQHIYQCRENKKFRKLTDLIDPNDLIDLCALSDSYEQGFIFISNDAKINKILDSLYTKQQKEFVSLFINYKFNY